MPRYGKCCCCFSARTGALILAILGIGAASLGIISNSVSLGVFQPHLDEMLDQIKQGSIYQFKQAEAELQAAKPYYEALWNRLDLIKESLPWIFVLQIFVGIFDLTMNGCMLYGVTKNRSCMILPWLIWGMIGLVALTVVSVGGFIVFCVFGVVGGVTLGQNVGVLTGLIFIAIMTPILGLGYYLWFVVQSVYLDIKEGDKPVNEEELEKAANLQKYVEM
jgi:uncharacterized membrane protein